MGQMSIFDGSKPLKITKPIRLIELFAGIGAQAAALRNIGANFEHYRVCEFDKYAIKSYNAVHGTNFKTSDIRDIHAEDLGIIEYDKYTYIMTYSFPCTDLSNAGKRAGMKRGGGTRSGLLWEVERLLRELRDRGGQLPLLLMENVPQVHSATNKDDFDCWCNFLLELGYNNKWADLNAKDYGVPQNRDRTFMVSWLGDLYYDFPEPKKLKLRLEDMLEENVDEKYYLTDDEIEKITYPCAIYNKDVSCTIRTTGRRSLDRHAFDILIDKSERERQATPKEYWRLMGFFDEDFEKAREVNSETQLCKQAGNSIVVPVLEEIFGKML